MPSEEENMLDMLDDDDHLDYEMLAMVEQLNGENLRAWLTANYAQTNENDGVIYKSDIQTAMFNHFNVPRNYQVEHRACIELGIAISELFPMTTETRRGNSRHGYRRPGYTHLVRKPVV